MWKRIKVPEASRSQGGRSVPTAVKGIGILMGGGGGKIHFE